MAKQWLLISSLFVFWLGVVLLGYWLWPVASVELRYQAKQVLASHQDKSFNLPPVQSERDALSIPNIEASAEIVWNVDHANQQTYELALQKGVAHAAVSSYPGEQGNVFLFAHSNSTLRTQRTRNTMFYLLPKLKVGDPIYVDREGVRYHYQVTGYSIVNPDQVEYLTQFSPISTLTLVTCYPLGTSLKRYLVFATLVSAANP